MIDPRPVTTSARVHRWRDEAAVTLTASDYTTTWLPDCGMLGVSLTHRGDELLALPRSIADYRKGMPKGGYTGLPLNAPYANRLSQRRFSLAGREVDVHRSAASDRNHLPIHGTLQAQPFTIESVESDARTARIVARHRHREPEQLAGFPFAHDYVVTIELSGRGLRVTTTVQSDEPGSVPVSFGWHPFLRVPATPRSQWQLRLPGRSHVELDDVLLPTGRHRREASETRVLGRRTFDDHYDLGRDRRFTLAGRDRRIDLRFDAGYAHAQIYLPPIDASGWLTTDFICIEPMTAPINALVDGTHLRVSDDAPYSATFTIAARAIARSG